MKLDLNNPEDFTFDNFKKLIAETDDSVNTQYRVTTDGIFFASQDVGNQNLGNILFRFETNDAGNGYAGVDASNSENWVKRIFEAVKKNYPEPESDYIDEF